MNHHVFTFETGVASDRGRIREVNEDRWYADERVGIWLVADGMGGHTNGKLASYTVAESAKTIGQAASAPDLLARFTDRMLRANQELLEISANSDAIVGSTVTSVLIFGCHFACVWAGDSRVYLIRNGVISQITHDHTEVQDLVDRGVITREEAHTWPRRNVITRAIGVGDDLELDTIHGQVMEDDRFVLCSDGLTGHVSDEEICEIVSARSPQEACEEMIGLTLNRGATDNVTVVVARCLNMQDRVIVGGAGPAMREGAA